MIMVIDCLREGGRGCYIGGYINSGSSNQTNLKEWCRCNLGGGGEPMFKAGADTWSQGDGGVQVGPDLSSSRSLLRGDGS
jgi:hypothetical protein